MEKCPIFHWSDPHIFTPLPKWLSSIIFEISVARKGNTVEFHPAKIFWMDIETAKNIEVIAPKEETNNNESTIELKKLDRELGIPFILSTWKFATGIFKVDF